MHATLAQLNGHVNTLCPRCTSVLPSTTPPAAPLDPQAISLSLRLDLPGYHDILVNAKGATPAEAGRALQEALITTRQALTPARPTLAAVVAQCLTRGLAKAAATQDAALAARLSKAAWLALSGRVVQDEYGTVVGVRSQETDTLYALDPVTGCCGCKSAAQVPLCKHAMARLMVERAERG